MSIKELEMKCVWVMKKVNEWLVTEDPTLECESLHDFKLFCRRKFLSTNKTWQHPTHFIDDILFLKLLESNPKLYDELVEVACSQIALFHMTPEMLASSEITLEEHAYLDDMTRYIKEGKCTIVNLFETDMIMFEKFGQCKFWRVDAFLEQILKLQGSKMASKWALKIKKDDKKKSKENVDKAMKEFCKEGGDSEDLARKIASMRVCATKEEDDFEVVSAGEDEDDDVPELEGASEDEMPELVESKPSVNEAKSTSTVVITETVYRPADVQPCGACAERLVPCVDHAKLTFLCPSTNKPLSVAAAMGWKAAAVGTGGSGIVIPNPLELKSYFPYKLPDGKFQYYALPKLLKKESDININSFLEEISEPCRVRKICYVSDNELTWEVYFKGEIYTILHSEQTLKSLASSKQMEEYLTGFFLRWGNRLNRHDFNRQSESCKRGYNDACSVQAAAPHDEIFMRQLITSERAQMAMDKLENEAKKAEECTKKVEESAKKAEESMKKIEEGAKKIESEEVIKPWYAPKEKATELFWKYNLGICGILCLEFSDHQEVDEDSVNMTKHDITWKAKDVDGVWIEYHYTWLSFFMKKWECAYKRAFMLGLACGFGGVKVNYVTYEIHDAATWNLICASLEGDEHMAFCMGRELSVKFNMETKIIPKTKTEEEKELVPLASTLKRKREVEDSLEVKLKLRIPTILHYLRLNGETCVSLLPSEELEDFFKLHFTKEKGYKLINEECGLWIMIDEKKCAK